MGKSAKTPKSMKRSGIGGSSMCLKTRGRPRQKIASKTPRTTPRHSPNLYPVPSKRWKRISLVNESNRVELPLIESVGVASSTLKRRGRPSRKSTAVASETVTRETPKTSVVLSKRPKRISLGRQSNRKESPPKIASSTLKRRGRPSRKSTGVTSETVTRETPKVFVVPSKQPKRISLSRQSNRKESPPKVSSLNLKRRGRPRKNTPTSRTHPSETSRIIGATSCKSRSNSLLKLCGQEKSKLGVSLECLSMHPKKRVNHSRKRTTQRASTKNDVIETPITSAPVKRSKRISEINQNNLKELLLSVNRQAISTSLKIIRNQSTKIELQPEIKASKRTKKETRKESSLSVGFRNRSRKTTNKTPRNAESEIPSIISTPFKRSERIALIKAIKRVVNLAASSTERTIAPPLLFKVPTACQSAASHRRRSIRVSSLEPMIRRRNTLIHEDRSHIQLAKDSLHLSAVQESLTCRETEFKEIHKLIESKILENSGGCMYISGAPGTGKTACIAMVIKSLKIKTEEKNLPESQFVQINAMRLTKPEQAYVQIYHQLTATTVSSKQAYTLLETLFNTSSSERKTIVLVVDEFDMMKSQGDRVRFNLLDWATKETAQLYLVAIGNIINPSQIITKALTSRLGSTRFIFQPYTHNQLQTIVQARLIGLNIFDNEAIQLVAKKVASISGDCRRTLDICRRAAEIGERDCAGNDIIISTSHVCKAFEEMIINPKGMAIKGCSKYEKLFLQAVAAEITRTGVDETVLFQVYRQLETICALNGVAVPDPGIALRISSRLGSSRLLICEHSCASIHQKIMLNVTEDEISYAYTI